MLLKDNFNEFILISERPVIFYPEMGKDISMNIPNIMDFYTNIHLQQFIAIASLTPKELQKHISSVVFDSTWSLINLFILQNAQNELLNDVEFTFKFLFGEQFKKGEDRWVIGNIILHKEWFDRILEILLISMGIKTFAEQSKFQAQKPQWLIDKEAEIKRIKSQNNKRQNQSQDFQQIEKIFIQLNYELGYSFEELSNMNYYHIRLLQSYVPKIISYDVQKRAASAGLTKKKLKYITDK